MAFDPRPTLAQLTADSQAERLAALRYLKNDIVGHFQRKEQWIQYGVLRPIVGIVETGASYTNGDSLHRFVLGTTAMTDQDRARLHGLQLLASFANAGPAFLPPLCASGALDAALSNVCLANRHIQINLSSLRVLRDLTAAATEGDASMLDTSKLADSIFSNDTLDSFFRIISHNPPSREVDYQVSLIAYLIRKLCKEERHQTALVNHGILDALAIKLASFAVAEGQVLPKADVIARAEGLTEFLPPPALSTANLEMVLGAIAAIITDSPYRACRLLLSPSILAVFPVIDTERSPYSGEPGGALELPGLRPTKQTDHDPMDYFLPFLPNQSRSHAILSAATPAGGPTTQETTGLSSRSTSKVRTSATGWNPPTEESFGTVSDWDHEEAESPLIPWLINLVRIGRRGETLAAASVLTSLFKAGFAYKTRELTLGLLVVPILLSMLSEIEPPVPGDGRIVPPAELASRLELLQEIPAVLAHLITDSEPLQKAAYDCNAVKTISKLLKFTYDSPVPEAKARPWAPEETGTINPSNLPPDSRLGIEGQNGILIHRVRVRENCLKALGALAISRDEYRKAIIDQDAIAYIVESLCQSPGKPKQAKDRTKSESNGTGLGSDITPSECGKNPNSVIIAACYAVRMLSRSAHILRTALTDSGVAVPLMRLLHHSDIDVQIAATASLCNLVLDFSPMRESLVEDGVVSVLCEHAHSTNATLRLNALWALKHLVHAARVDFKKQCLEELESYWLVQLICDDTEDDALYLARGRADDLDEDIDMGSVEDTGHSWLSESFYKIVPSNRGQAEIRILRSAESRLAALREAEANPIRKARHDDLAIQEQGLGFIRNLIGSAHSNISADGTNDTAEMIDFLFATLGQERLFDILSSKLRHKVSHALTRRETAARSESRVLPPHGKIIEAVIYILVHMAASIPRHRQLVIGQTELLKTLSKLFNNQDREVRLALCHLINNLTWQDDVSDASACSQRAVELRKLGFLSKLEALGQSDDELDVRERAKSALWQMRHGY